VSGYHHSDHTTLAVWSRIHLIPRLSTCR
jgi:hypothetical protein